MSELTQEHRVFLSREFAGPNIGRLALAAGVVSFAFFIAAAPFATHQLMAVPAFVPAYESALVLSDLITAVLLFGKFNVLRSRALFVLASGYLFTALIAFAHALTFPNVFAPTGLLGGGAQTTPWLYMIWHGGFPLFVILYAFLMDESGIAEARRVVHRKAGGTILIGVGAVIAGVCGLTFIVTMGHSLLPVLMIGSRFTDTMTVVVTCLWTFSLFALIVLWWKRPHTVLDLWLMVVMGAWLFEIGLSAVLNAGRFDLGWYTGRVYGLLAAGSLLIVLLIESSMHYARLLQLSTALSDANKALEQLSLQDSLTSIANRRFFDRYLTRQVNVARRQKRMLAMVLCDVDHFKKYNDYYGHQAGDECLKQVAAALRSCCRRPADIVARYGGEEFALILPDTELVGAIRIAETARAAVAKLNIRHERSSAGPIVSISGGIAVMHPKMGTTAVDLIAIADQQLFQAKHDGRNRMAAVQPEAA